MRKSMIVANWKMNGNQLAVQSWLNTLIAFLQTQEQNTKQCEWVFFPPSVYLGIAAQAIHASDLSTLCLGGQNCYMASSGAFTGEISPDMLADIGCQYALAGHSERRQLFQENNAHVAKKVLAIQAAGLTPILCVGETALERQKNETKSVIAEQLATVFSLCSEKHSIVIAYEPLWAIGTGLNATPEQAQRVHEEIREWVSVNIGASFSTSLSILYGGSVNPANAAGLLAEKDIDGLLVGGASLKASDFIAIGKPVYLL
ncbi:MAG: hypothetical protein RLZ35_1001 [Pseudomonadota bacterium]|jgi:triosephosphate isomerase